MEKSIFKFVLAYSLKSQILITILTIVSFPFLYFSLDLPKKIVNRAIGDHPDGRIFLGYEFDQIDYLFLLSFLFLGLVFINGGFKYYINLYKGRIGERMLRRLRFELYRRIIRFPVSQFKKVSPGEIIPIITVEVEPLGGFIGDAFALPIFQGGTLLVYLFFIFMQDVTLGAAAILFYPIQFYVIPQLQKRVNLLAKKRSLRLRRLAYRVNESMQGIQDIRTNDTSRYHLADISNKLNDMYELRFDLYQRKFFVKFLNNFFNQLTPFFFYAIGGYFVIKGDISFGSLVAVLAAYKDLAPPWRELLTYYQSKEDIRIKYESVVSQFNPENLVPLAMQIENRENVKRLKGKIALSHVTYSEGGQRFLNDVTADIDLETHYAIVGSESSARDKLLQILAHLISPTSGGITVNKMEYKRITESVFGRRMAYVGANSILFTDSLFNNIVYALKHDPERPAEYDPSLKSYLESRKKEAYESGNSQDDILDDWIDYKQYKVKNEEELKLKVLEILEELEFENDLYQMGLQRRFDAKDRPDFVFKILKARKRISEMLQKPQFKDLVRQFHEEEYNDFASVAENLIYGTMVGQVFSEEVLAQHPFVREAMVTEGLDQSFFEEGVKLAQMMISMFAGLKQAHEFFDRFSFISSDEIVEYEEILSRFGESKVRKESLDETEQNMFIKLPLKIIPVLHRLDMIDEKMKQKILKVRKYFIAHLSEYEEKTKTKNSLFQSFCADQYNSASSLQDNILFGKLNPLKVSGQQKLNELIAQLIDEFDLMQEVKLSGLMSWVGVLGSRLSQSQKQKIILARALIKQPDLLILDQPLTAVNMRSREKIHQYVMDYMKGKCIVWSLHMASFCRDFDEVIIMKDGEIKAKGKYVDLKKKYPEYAPIMSVDTVGL